MICTVVSFLLFLFRSSWLSFFFSYCLSFRFGHIRGAFIVSFDQIFGNKIKNKIWRCSDVLVSSLLTVILELLGCEPCPVVRNEHFWVYLMCENPASSLIVAVVEVLICTTSGHLEKTFTMRRNIIPSIGPAKSIWIFSQAQLGFGHGDN